MEPLSELFIVLLQWLGPAAKAQDFSIESFIKRNKKIGHLLCHDRAAVVWRHKITTYLRII